MSRPADSKPSSQSVKSPLALVAAAFALGILWERTQPPGLPGIPLLACAVALLAGLVALQRQRREAAFALALVGFTAGGASAFQLFNFRFPPNHVSYLANKQTNAVGPVRLEGRVVTTPYRTPYGLQFDVKVLRIERGGHDRPMTGLVRLRLEQGRSAESFAALDALGLQDGDLIRAVAELKRPHVYRNPGSFDFRQWMESFQDVYWVGTIRSPFLIQKLSGTGPPRISSFIHAIRQRLRRAIDRMYPPWSAVGRNGAVLKAILLGDRASLDSGTIENFRKAGLYHLLVIAGLHVGLLALLLEAFLRLFRLRETNRTMLVLALLLAYACLVQQRASTLRATLMISVYLLARLFYRGHSVLNAIGFAALVLLLYRPMWLFESGFELSFAAALLIVTLVVPILERSTEPYRRALVGLDRVERDDALAPRLAQFRLDIRALIARFGERLSLARHPAVARTLVVGGVGLLLWTVNMLLFSGILQLGLLLPMAETFHRVSYAGIGLNALAIPVMTLLLGFAIPAVLLSALLPSLAPLLAKGLSIILSVLFSLVELPHLPHWLSYRVPDPPIWVAFGFACSIVMLAWALGRSRRTCWLGAGALTVFTVLISWHPFPPALRPGVLQMTALDCGRGGSLFVQFPDRTTMLIDACDSSAPFTPGGGYQGTRWNPGDEIVSPFLWHLGIRRLDVLVLSDDHWNHLLGIAAIVRNFKVGEFWHGSSSLSPSYQALLALVREHHIPIRQVTAGDGITRGATSFRVVWPPRSHGTKTSSSDEDSLVFRLASGNSSLLLSGDVSRKEARRLLKSDVPLQSQVLQLTRLGSRASPASALLSMVSPRLAVVNRLGSRRLALSNASLVDVFGDTKTRIFPTDMEGAVTLEIRRGVLSVHTPSRPNHNPIWPD